LTKFLIVFSLKLYKVNQFSLYQQKIKQAIKHLQRLDNQY